MWAVGDISFDLAADLTDDPVVTVFVTTPAGLVTLIGEVFDRGAVLVLRGVHIQDATPNRIGAANLMVMAQALMERLEYDGLEIEGAARTTGANPGHRPGRLRFRRRAGSSPARPPP
jgi:hypothetical protein